MTDTKLLLRRRRYEFEEVLRKLVNLAHPSAEVLSDKTRMDLFIEYANELDDIYRHQYI